jgi:TolA-binding protein
MDELLRMQKQEIQLLRDTVACRDEKIQLLQKEREVRDREVAVELEEVKRQWQEHQRQKEELQRQREELQRQKEELQRQKEENQRQKEEIQRQHEELQRQREWMQRERNSLHGLNHYVRCLPPSFSLTLIELESSVLPPLFFLSALHMTERAATATDRQDP